MSDADKTELPIHPFTGQTAIGLVAGRPVWPILGGSGEAEAETEDEQEDEVDGEPADGEGEDQENEAEDEGDIDWKEQAEKNKELLRRHKAANKVSPDRLDALRQAEQELQQLKDAQLPEPEKQLADAKKQARAEALQEVAQDRAADKIEVALTGIVDDPAQIIEDLNLARFVQEDGAIDIDAVKTLQKKYQRIAGPKKKPTAPNLGQGDQGEPPTLQTRIAAAQAAGDTKTAMRLKAEQVAESITKSR